jgi:hypothetical protein
MAHLPGGKSVAPTDTSDDSVICDPLEAKDLSSDIVAKAEALTAQAEQLTSPTTALPAADLASRLKNQVKKLPYIRRLARQIDRLTAERDRLAAELARAGGPDAQLLDPYPMWVPLGHFYSPFPSLDEVRASESRLFAPVDPSNITGIDMREEAQLRLLDRFMEYYRELPFNDTKTEGLRYYFDNPAYAYSDGIFLHCMIRHLKPNKIIEVGSGYSSCVTLDTNELFFDNKISCTFIEPYPDLLLSLLKPGDGGRIELIDKGLQDCPVEKFQELEAGDILFIDSTHVSRIGSDVNYLFFEILPSLPSGVFIHLHDIFYPLEYPKEWIYEGRAWHEIYLLRAFLLYNESFRIEFFNLFLETRHEARFAADMPLCLKNTGGSIWLKKL